ncbi:MAG: hypothetical protein WCD35_18885, partial [Mycobacteriales bacterium]
VVLEGQARRGAEEADAAGVQGVHAPGEGDDTLAELAGRYDDVTLVTADRALRERAQAVGAAVVGPRWLTERLG